MERSEDMPNKVTMFGWCKTGIHIIIIGGAQDYYPSSSNSTTNVVAYDFEKQDWDESYV